MLRDTPGPVRIYTHYRELPAHSLFVSTDDLWKPEVLVQGSTHVLTASKSGL